jgi:hypothetical protein
MSAILANNGVLTPEQCAYLISYLNNNEKWTPAPHPTWDERMVDLKDVDDPIAVGYMIEAYKKIRSSMPEGFDAESFSLVIWNEHTGMNLHTDEVGSEWREYSSVIYLNENFHGGNTYFPDQGLSVEPRIGMGIVFQANDEHPHLVTEVVGGKRYTISSFWSNQEGHNFYKEWINENSDNWI